MDTNCNGNKCPELAYQAIGDGNRCTKKASVVDEDLDGCM
jgi:hypothetical protein